MKFLIDQNRSSYLAKLLNDAGHEAVHTAELGLEHAEDSELLALADSENRVVVSGDTDFGALLVMGKATSPSLILFRARYLLRAEQQAEVILQHLDEVASDLSKGAIVVVTDSRIRIRHLPLITDQ